MGVGSKEDEWCYWHQGKPLNPEAHSVLFCDLCHHELDLMNHDALDCMEVLSMWLRSTFVDSLTPKELYDKMYGKT